MSLTLSSNLVNGTEKKRFIKWLYFKDGVKARIKRNENGPTPAVLTDDLFLL